MSINKEKEFQISKTVYGPVKSWRFGNSLGIDLLFHNSICSFNCIYCQLGKIQNVTTEIKEYVETQKVVDDFQEVLKNCTEKIDIIMFSGNGEPTLASNLGEVNQRLKEIVPQAKTAILTNSVHLHDPLVQQNLKGIDKVILKLDAANERTMKLINRPHASVTYQSIINSIMSFKKIYEGELEVQMMFMPLNKNEVQDLAHLLQDINPSLVQLNTPKREYPSGWYRENRGNHKDIHDHKTTKLKTVDKLDAQELERTLKELTGLEILSIYR